MNTQRQRHGYAGYGWAWIAFLSGMMALGLVFGEGAGEWSFYRVTWIAIMSTCAYYSFKAYEKAQRRRNHPSA